MNPWKVVSLVIVLLIIGVLTALVVRLTMDVEHRIILVVILFGPVVLYAVLRGQIKELAIGSAKATFREAARESVPAFSGPTRPIEPIGPTLEDLQMVGDKGFEALEGMLAHYKLSETGPIVLSIRLGRGDYPRIETLGFVEKLSRYRSFQIVAFEDERGKLEAHMPAWAFRQALSDTTTGDPLLESVNRGADYGELRQYPYVSADNIRPTNDLAQAMDKLVALSADALPVVDHEQKLCGVVEGGRLTRTILARMLRASGNEGTTRK